MVRCKNCGTDFPTKYRYTRHQCGFNVDKVVSVADAGMSGKQFVKKNDSERSQTRHDSTQENVCEHCNKQFASANGLRTHKESYCTKVSKFYHSKVTIWKCIKCNQVFATPALANHHQETCVERIIADTNKEHPAKKHPSIPNVEKVLTELLLQCEYCNRTYADRNLLLAHQKKHTTEINYECITCKNAFESYTTAAKHWMTKCSDEVNLFDIPKVTCCEYCESTFKSHEMLYTHKIEKKHYTPKLHITKEDVVQGNQPVNSGKSKDDLVTLMKDVVASQNVSITRDEKGDGQGDKENGNPNKGNEHQNVTPEKNKSKQDKSHDLGNQEPQENKQGCKQKWPKQVVKAKCLSFTAEANYKYQCEQCVLVFDTITELETHRKEEHAFVRFAEECQQIFIPATPGRDNNKSKQDESHDLENQVPKKKKQGRKQKHHKQVVKAKRLSITAEEGCKYQCEQCALVFDAITELETHRKKEHASVFPFEECGQVVRSARALVVHSPAHQSLKPYACEQCGQSFLQNSQLLQHLHFHQGIKSFVCPYKDCKARYTIYSQLKDHTSSAHPQEKFFRCKVCNTGSMTGLNYYQHRLMHKNDPRYRCNICKKRFFRAGDLTKHGQIHTVERPYPCQHCGKLFKNIGNLNRHRQIHTDEWPYCCEICGRKFQTNANMNRHRRTHTNERPFACEICKREFRTKGDRNRHRRIHTDERPFFCDVCGKSFKSNVNMDRHRQTHTNKHQYRCKICAKKFQSRGDRNRHRQIHSDDRPYACEVCGRTFKSHEQMNRHRRIHTDEWNRNKQVRTEHPK